MVEPATEPLPPLRKTMKQSTVTVAAAVTLSPAALVTVRVKVVVAVRGPV